MADLTKARDFILGNARLLDRRRFAFRFEGGTAKDVVAALRPYQNGVKHRWLSEATNYCWRCLEKGELDRVGPDDAISILRFLEWAPERERASATFEVLGEIIRSKLVAYDPQSPGYVKTPLDFATSPGKMARRLFDAETIATHLDVLSRRQQADGGWPISWAPPSPAAVGEWRAFVTIKSLVVLDKYGRLRETSA